MKCLCKNCKLQRSTLELDTDSLTFNPFHIDLDSNITNIFEDSLSDVL